MEDVDLMRGTLGPISRQVFVPQGYQFFSQVLRILFVNKFSITKKRSQVRPI